MTVKDEQGYALVTVIWFVGLLAAVSAALVSATTLAVQSTRNHAGLAAASAYADGLITLTGYQLAQQLRKPDLELKVHLDGMPVNCKIDDKHVASITVQDHKGLMNLNLASHTSLRDYIELVLGDSVAAQRAADAIVTYRDGASVPNGNTQTGIKRIFQTVEQLDDVPGVNDTEVLLLLPFFTVHGRTTQIDYNYSRLRAVTSRQAAPTAATPSQVQGAGIVSIDVRVMSSDTGLGTGKSAVLEVLPHARRPFTVLLWRNVQLGRLQPDATAEHNLHRNAPDRLCEQMLASD